MVYSVCPECGSSTINTYYGMVCSNKSCGWQQIKTKLDPLKKTKSEDRIAFENWLASIEGNYTWDALCHEYHAAWLGFQEAWRISGASEMREALQAILPLLDFMSKADPKGAAPGSPVDKVRKALAG